MRFERIVYQFSHLQLRRSVFVVGVDRRAVKARQHALFEESSRAKHLPHRRFRRYFSGRLGGRGVILEGHIPVVGSLCRALDLRSHGIRRRIGCTPHQKSAFTLTYRNRETSYDNIPFALAPSAAHPSAAGPRISLNSGHLRTEQADCFSSALPLSHCVTLGSGDFERFPSRGANATNLSWGAT